MFNKFIWAFWESINYKQKFGDKKPSIPIGTCKSQLLNRLKAIK